ncbi:putative kinesin [Mytilinidion resinicola]|uniref:Kinesin n=1 Tax=Mytilinidion resinicola TaxID=574789 RepID=A0A6A6YAD2_9PEZI|nr:putative kinesin [Mytilinidion resinicola]KAF2805782.1 putative kinesin [Mytilinidion resinicola]
MTQPSATIAFGDRNRGFQAGIINGPVHHHPPPERAETPPNPSCAVPFRRDPDFVDRGTLLDQIRETCSAPASRIALVGLGGVGKSQLAIEHCYQTANRSPTTWVFWVHASNAGRIEQGYRDIADQVKLAGRNDPQADVFKLVRSWLRNEKNGKWLLVLDNADDAAALSIPASNDQKTQASGGDGAYPRYFSSYLPQSKNGSVLVTSRTRSVALRLVEESDIIPIEPMDNAGAQTLLQKKLGEEVDKGSTAELAKAVEFMPLALVQAAAYIRQRAPRCSMQQYLEAFYKSDKKRTGLLDYDGGHLRRDEEAKNSILITWQISFDHILHARRSAADLLSLMSFFDRQGIPEALVRNQSGARNRQGGVEAINTDSENSDSDNSKSEASTDDGFEEDIRTLRNYSFIALTTDATTFDMHRLVQLATRKWLEGQGQLEIWKQQYIDNLCTAFPTGEHKNWAQCQALFPHAKLALSQPPKSEESLQQWALLLYKAAWYAWQKGSLSDAEKLSVKSMKVREKLLSKEHTDTLNSIAMVGLAIKLAGRWREAEELEVQVMETSSRVLGEEHPSTLTSMGNLASTYRNQGRWKEAEELEVQVMETSSRVLGEEHPSTLTSMANLAFTFKAQGRNDDAILLMEKCSQLQVQVLGPQHPHAIPSVRTLNQWQLENMGIGV